MIHDSRIREFTDLKAWKEAHQLVLLTYKLVRSFPTFEQHGLANQMRRAVVSITSNIAEGFGRRNYKEKIQFYYLAQGSLTEIKNQLIIANDVGYCTNNVYLKLREQADVSHQLLQGLISKTKKLSLMNLKS